MNEKNSVAPESVYECEIVLILQEKSSLLNTNFRLSPIVRRKYVLGLGKNILDCKNIYSDLQRSHKLERRVSIEKFCQWEILHRSNLILRGSQAMSTSEERRVLVENLLLIELKRN